MLNSTFLATCSPVADLELPDEISKNDLNRCSIRASEEGISVSRIMLLTCASDWRTRICWVLYAFDGSESAGRMVVMKRVKISYRQRVSRNPNAHVNRPSPEARVQE